MFIEQTYLNRYSYFSGILFSHIFLLFNFKAHIITGKINSLLKYRLQFSSSLE